MNATLDELQALYDSLDSDLMEAKKLQQSLVSDRHRDFGTAEVSMLLRSSGHVGGDLVGIFPVSGTRIGPLRHRRVGPRRQFGTDDGAAGWISVWRRAGTERRAATDGGRQLRHAPAGRTIAALNELFLSELETEHYFTLLLADVDLVTGRVVMAQAGHPYPAVQRADGRVEMVGDGRPAGGPDSRRGVSTDFEVHLAPGRPADDPLRRGDGMRGAGRRRCWTTRVWRDCWQRLRGTRGPACLEALVVETGGIRRKR